MRKFLLFLWSVTLIFMVSQAHAAIINVPDDYGTIQAAIDAADNGDVIIVAAETYNEDVVIDKSVTLRSSAGAASTIVNGGMQLSVNVNNITIEGFTINNGALIGSEYIGINIAGGTSGHTINANILNGLGGDPDVDPRSRGILFGSNVTNTTVSGNTSCDWWSGVYINPSSYLTFNGNTFCNNLAGIGSDTISHVTITNNTFTSNTEGWGVNDAGPNVRANYNRFSGNTENGFRNYCDLDPEPPAEPCDPGEAWVDVTNNWWGDECGPGGGINDAVTGTPADGPGDHVQGNVHFDPWLLDGTIYEHGEDGMTDGWRVFDNIPFGASITNIYDSDRGSRVIELSGSSVLNGYEIRNEDGSNWQNATQVTNQSILEWTMKCSEEVRVFVDVETDAGHRFIYYTPADSDNLGTGEYVHQGLGSDITDSQWHTFARDLEADLAEAQPGVTLLEVNGLKIRGNGRFDEIKLVKTNIAVSVSDVTVYENAGPAVFTISALPTPCRSITMEYATSDNTAIAGNDYVSSTGIATIAADAGSVNVNVPLINDDFFEQEDETFSLRLKYAFSARISDGSGEGTIIDDSDTIWIYEDAEDGDTLGWSIYDNLPPVATITNLYDTGRGNRVIELSGLTTYNGYELRNEDGSDWQNSTQFVIAWSMKSTWEMRVFVDAETDAGHRYIYYTPVDTDTGANPSGEYVHHGLGSDIMDGEWHTFVRDLQADLAEFQPGVTLLEVNGIRIRGSGRVDDVKLMPPGAGLSINDITVSEDGGTAVFTITSSETDSSDITVNYDTNDATAVAPDDYVDSQGTATIPSGSAMVDVSVTIEDDTEVEGDETFSVILSNANNAVIRDNTGEATIPSNDLPPSHTVYEDAEDGDTLGWLVYDNNPMGATVTNVSDPSRGSRVIVLSGDGVSNGYLFEDGIWWFNTTQTNFYWGMKCSEEIRIFVDVETDAGHRYIYYTPVDTDNLGTGEYVHHGLGSDIIDGKWHTFIRDLEADLKDAQPAANITVVNGIRIRGSGSLDDIILY